MSQDVLVIPSKKLENFYSRRGFYFTRKDVLQAKQIVMEHGVFIDRKNAEQTEDVKQVVAVGVIRCGARILCLRRARKSNRKTLRLRWTIMIGGHVDDGDGQSRNPAFHCLLRELREEIGVAPEEPPQLIGVVVDPENPVGRLHIGFVFDVQVRSPEVRILSKFDNSEFVNSRSSRNHRFMSESEIDSLVEKLDSWSYLYVSSDFPNIHYNWSLNVGLEEELPFIWR